MKFSSVEQLAHEMSRCAILRMPFLFAVDFEMEHSVFVENPLSQHEILFRTPLGGNSEVHSTIKGDLIAHPIPYDEYQKRFQVIHDGLYRGDSFLTNLTIKTPIECNLGLEDIFHGSHAPYCLYVPNHFVCFSPERFVTIQQGVISTNPMKGTIDASIPNAEEQIMNDAKEKAEHVTVVDLLRNDIGINATNVEVSRFRYIDRIDTPQRSILQVSSEIKGKLPYDWQHHLGEIICSMLPAGSISGAPKQATINLIKRAEGEPRGFYSGVFGYYNGEVLDSAVMIRYIEQVGSQYYFRSGGGITVNSDCLSEYNEVIAKIYLPTL